MNAQHSAKSAEWYTPTEVVEAARHTLGGTIDLDPASCAQANERVRATRYIDATENGLVAPWFDEADSKVRTVFLNPPGGRNKDGSLVTQFWRALTTRTYCLDQNLIAIWVGFSLEQLQTLQSERRMAGPTPLDYCMCVPSKRLRFSAPGGTGPSPTHANYISLVMDGGGVDKVVRYEAQSRFRAAFEPIGQVVLR